MTKVCIGIGSNVGDREAHLAAARRGLEALPRTRLLAFSDAIETEPVGPVPQGRYLNAAALIETSLSPHDLLAGLRNIEAGQGRPAVEQREKWGPRTLDLDILLFGDRIISDDVLEVPHPLMHDRLFVLRPLAQIAPDVVHPVLEMTVQALLDDLEQKQQTSGQRG